MPRKAKSTSNAKSQPNGSDPEPQPTLTDEPNSSEQPSPKDRDVGGKFTKGNAGGPGNPHARACAKMLEVFRNAISEQEMVELCRMLYLKAVGGDIGAAKIILSYKIGKPLPAPHPDSIDRDEWDHYQNDAIRTEEMKHVMSSLPTHSGNDIVRVSLPVMTTARMNEFAAQLLDGHREYAEKGERREKKGKRKNKTGTPLANGESGRKHAEKGEERKERGEKAKTTEPPIPNGKSGRTYAENEDKTTSPPDTSKAPLPNGKLDRKSSAPTSVHRSPSTTKAPLPNGKNKTVPSGRKGRNKVKNQWMQPLAKRLKAEAAHKKTTV